MSSNLKKNFIWNIIGLSSYSFVSLFLMIAVTIINGTSIAGIFSYSFSLCTVFLYIALYYNRTYQISNDKYSFNDFFSFRCTSILSSMIFIILFSTVSRFNTSKLIIIVLLMLFRCIDAISDCFYAYLQKEGKLYQVGITYFLKSTIGTILFIICDYYTNNILLSICFLVLTNIIIFVFYDLLCFKKIFKEKIKYSTDNLKSILISTFPVFIFSFLSIFLANSQKIVITYYTANELQAIFGILIMPATFISLIGHYLIQPFITKFISLLKKKNYKSFNELFLKINIFLFLIGLVGFIICYFIGIPILNMLYHLSLNDYKLDLLIIILGSIFTAISMIISNVLTILKTNNEQALTYFFVSVVTIILCSILTRYYSILGAAISYLVSSLLLVFGLIAIYSKKYYFLNKK